MLHFSVAVQSFNFFYIEVRGVQAKIRLESPLAKYVHCASHRLNLVLNTACGIPEFVILIDNLKKLGAFFSSSPKRQDAFRSQIQKSDDIRVKRMKKVCLTNPFVTSYYDGSGKRLGK